jgi:hypothetical protein
MQKRGCDPNLFSALGYVGCWSIYSGITPFNLGILTIFRGLLEIVQSHVRPNGRGAGSPLHTPGNPS